MDNSTQYDDELMRYIDGEMTESEKIDFEKQLAADRSLKQAMDNLQLAKDAVRSYGLKEKVSGIHQEMMKELKTETPVKQISNVRRIDRYVWPWPTGNEEFDEAWEFAVDWRGHFVSIRHARNHGYVYGADRAHTVSGPR